MKWKSPNRWAFLIWALKADEIKTHLWTTAPPIIIVFRGFAIFDYFLFTGSNKYCFQVDAYTFNAGIL